MIPPRVRLKLSTQILRPSPLIFLRGDQLRLSGAAFSSPLRLNWRSCPNSGRRALRQKYTAVPSCHHAGDPEIVRSVAFSSGRSGVFRHFVVSAANSGDGVAKFLCNLRRPISSWAILPIQHNSYSSVLQVAEVNFHFRAGCLVRWRLAAFSSMLQSLASEAAARWRGHGRRKLRRSFGHGGTCRRHCQLSAVSSGCDVCSRVPCVRPSYSFPATRRWPAGQIRAHGNLSADSG